MLLSQMLVALQQVTNASHTIHIATIPIHIEDEKATQKQESCTRPPFLIANGILLFPVGLLPPKCAAIPSILYQMSEL